MAKLARSVHLTDPKSGRPVVLLPGEEPAPHLAALITASSAWEDGQAPDTDAQTGSTSDQPDTSGAPEQGHKQAAPAAKKTAAKKSARTPARGRDAAAEASSGD